MEILQLIAPYVIIGSAILAPVSVLFSFFAFDSNKPRTSLRLFAYLLWLNAFITVCVFFWWLYTREAWLAIIPLVLIADVVTFFLFMPKDIDLDFICTDNSLLRIELSPTGDADVRHIMTRGDEGTIVGKYTAEKRTVSFTTNVSAEDIERYGNAVNSAKKKLNELFTLTKAQ